MTAPAAAPERALPPSVEEALSRFESVTMDFAVCPVTTAAMDEGRARAALRSSILDALRQDRAKRFRAYLRCIRRARASESRALAAEEALRRVTEGMDRAGGDRDGMPECPWCRLQDGDDHTTDCELARARSVLSRGTEGER